MTTSVVVGGIFLAVDDLLRMVQVLVRSGADLVTHTRFEKKVLNESSATPWDKSLLMIPDGSMPCSKQ
jgi:hypothetical protein